MTAATLNDWGDAFPATRLTGGERLMSARLKARLGEMLLERELLEARVAALESGCPLAQRRSRPRARSCRTAAANPTVWPGCVVSGVRSGPRSTAAACRPARNPLGAEGRCHLFLVGNPVPENPPHGLGTLLQGCPSPQPLLATPVRRTSASPLLRSRAMSALNSPGELPTPWKYCGSKTRRRNSSSVTT